MTRRTKILVAIGIVLLIVILFFGAPKVAELISLGKRVGPATKPNDKGKIDRSVVDLATEAGVPLRVYALARMLASEVSQKKWTKTEAVAKAHVALNDAKYSSVFKGDLLKTLTYNKDPDRKGYFGTQSGGRFATTNDPHERDVKIANDVLQGKEPDVTAGADKFLDVEGLKSQKGVTKSAETTDRNWKAEGRERFEFQDHETWYYRKLGLRAVLS